MKIRNFLTPILCLVIAAPSPALADPFMKGAKKAVTTMNENADALVSNLIAHDMRSALAKATHEIAKLKGTDQQVNSFIESVNRLAHQYDSFLDNPDGHYDVTREHLLQSWDLYLELYSEQISNSWQPAAVNREFESAPGMILRAFNSLKETCGQGTFDPNMDLSLPISSALPPYEFDWNIMLRVGENGQFSTADYQGINYVDDHKGRQLLFDASKVAFGVSSGAAAWGGAVAFAELSGGASLAASSSAFGASLGGWASTGLAVMPYAAAAVVVMAVVMDFANREKMEKMKKQRVAAEFYKFDNTKRSQWIMAEYRQRCETVVNLIDPLVTDLEFIDRNYREPGKVAEYYAKDIKEMKTRNEEYQAFGQASCQLELARLHGEKQCVTFEEYDQAKVDFDDKKRTDLPACIKENKKISKIGCDLELNDSGLPSFDQEALQTIVDDFEKDDEQAADVFAKQIPNIRYLIYQIFAKNYAETQVALSKYLGNQMDSQRRQALNRLLKLAALYRDANNVGYAMELQGELAAFEEFSRLNREFKELVAMAIDAIFEKVDKNDFRLAINDWSERFSPFYDEYVHVDEVSSLNQKVLKLKKSMGLKE